MQQTTEGIAIAFDSRGSAYSDKGQYERAIQDYHRAIKLSPVCRTAIHNRGIAPYALGQFEDAAAEFERKLTLDAADSIDPSRLNICPAWGYGVIWLHLARCSMGVDDEGELKRNAAWVGYNKWPGQVAALYFDRMTYDQVFLNLRQ